MRRLPYLTFRVQLCLVATYFISFVQAAENGTVVYTDTCFEDRKGILPCSSTITGNLVLITFYGLILSFSGTIITEGAEMILGLRVPIKIIGGVILPIVGAIPDCAIILVSGLGKKEEAQGKLSVGMGTLAGSTIMLLTIAWAGSLLIGRCDLDDNGESIDGTGQGRLGLTDQGITLQPEIRSSIVIMLITSLFCLVVQSAHWNFGLRNNTSPQPAYIRNSALVTMIFCNIGLFGYIAYETCGHRGFKSRMGGGTEEINQSKVLHHASVMVNQLITSQCSEQVAASEHHIEEITDSSSQTDLACHSASMNGTKKIGYENEHDSNESKLLIEEENEEEDEHEETTAPKATGMVEKKPSNRGKIAAKACALLLFGLLLVSLLASPMCQALSALTDERNKPHYIPISPFYVSFIVTPICSNASELVSSFIFASRRKRENATLTYSQIIGACIVNNTLGFGIFMALVYFRELEWYYSAEVLVMLLVQFCVGLISFKKTYKVYMALPVGFIYILSLLLVYAMQKLLHWK